MAGVFKFSVGECSLIVHRGPLPTMYSEYRQRARLVDEFDLSSAEGEACFVGLGKTGEWPSLLVAQRFSPCEGGFIPGVLWTPETRLLFIGAGKRLLAYSADRLERLWEDTADLGFWSWQQHGNYVFMAAETELAAWDISGRLWTTMVEPPWTYVVERDQIHLDVMDKICEFGISEGPTGPTTG